MSQAEKTSNTPSRKEATTRSSSKAQEHLAAASQPPPQQYVRVETRWLSTARELEDLSEIAKQTNGNPAKRAEAEAYIIRLWSRVLHGELSPGAFWELFGVIVPPPVYPVMLSPGMYPAMPATTPVAEPAPAPVAPPEEDPEALERKRKRAKNRNAVAGEYV